MLILFDRLKNWKFSSTFVLCLFHSYKFRLFFFVCNAALVFDMCERTFIITAIQKKNSQIAKKKQIFLFYPSITKKTCRKVILNLHAFFDKKQWNRNRQENWTEEEQTLLVISVWESLKTFINSIWALQNVFFTNSNKVFFINFSSFFFPPSYFSYRPFPLNFFFVFF